MARNFVPEGADFVYVSRASWPRISARPALIDIAKPERWFSSGCTPYAQMVPNCLVIVTQLRTFGIPSSNFQGIWNSLQMAQLYQKYGIYVQYATHIGIIEVINAIYISVMYHRSIHPHFEM